MTSQTIQADARHDEDNILHSETLLNGVTIKIVSLLYGRVEMLADTNGPFQVMFRGQIADARKEYRLLKQRERFCS